MDAGWAQFLAAFLAAAIPVVVKMLNDFHERLTKSEAKVQDIKSPKTT